MNVAVRTNLRVTESNPLEAAVERKHYSNIVVMARDMLIYGIHTLSHGHKYIKEESLKWFMGDMTPGARL